MSEREFEGKTNPEPPWDSLLKERIRRVKKIPPMTNDELQKIMIFRNKLRRRCGLTDYSEPRLN